jgi:hypothetical protein
VPVTVPMFVAVPVLMRWHVPGRCTWPRLAGRGGGSGSGGGGGGAKVAVSTAMRVTVRMAVRMVVTV